MAAIEVDVIFHRLDQGTGFSRTIPGEPKRYRIDLLRILLGFLLLVALLGGAYMAKRAQWDEGAWGMSHMAAIVFGLVVGAIFGKEAAISHGA